MRRNPANMLVANTWKFKPGSRWRWLLTPLRKGFENSGKMCLIVGAGIEVRRMKVSDPCTVPVNNLANDVFQWQHAIQWSCRTTNRSARAKLLIVPKTASELEVFAVTKLIRATGFLRLGHPASGATSNVLQALRSLQLVLFYCSLWTVTHQANRVRLVFVFHCVFASQSQVERWMLTSRITGRNDG